MDDEKRATIREHLSELRRRLVIAAVAVAVATVAGFFITDRIFLALKAIAPGVDLIYTELPEYITTYFKVSLLAGLALALPVIVYQLVMFVSPGLTPRERRWLLVLMPGVFVSFALGATFAYFVLLPPAMRFLLTFGGDIARPQIRIGNYVSVVTTLVFWVGLLFEMPLVVAFLARLGVISHHFLARRRRWAIVLAFVVGAIITPTFDPVNQSLVAVPLIALYELSILLAWLMGRRRAATTGAAVPAEGPVSRE